MADTTLTSPIADNQRWTRRFLWLLMGVVSFRVIYLFTAIDFELSGDEAYYWDWGRRPDWCYYSKPPLIGWLMGLLRVVFGYKWWAVRLASIALGTLSLSLLFALGRRLFDARTGFFAALMLLLTPANAAANFGLTIDSPLILCWIAALLAFWHVITRPASRGGWLALTLAIGIGTLAKQMMLAFPGAMLLFALCSPPDRALLTRPAFWLCILGGLAFLLPMLWWNLQHGMVTLTHTQEHFHHHANLPLLKRLGQFLSFPLIQAGVWSPITFVLLIAALVGCARAWNSLDQRARFLFLFSAPGLTTFLLLAVRQDINPNWPAVFYLSAFVLGASIALRTPTITPWLRRGLTFGAALTLALYLAIPLIPVLSLKGSKKLDPCVSMRGWAEAGQLIGKLYERVPRPDHTLVLVLDHRHNASQMAFNMPQHPRVYRWNPEGKIESQYEVWPNGADKIGWDGFVIYPDSPEDHYQKKGLQNVVAKAFKQVQKLGDADVIIGNGVQRSFQVFLGKSMVHWPGPDVAKPPAQQKPAPPP